MILRNGQDHLALRQTALSYIRAMSLIFNVLPCGLRQNYQARSNHSEIALSPVGVRFLIGAGHAYSCCSAQELLSVQQEVVDGMQ